MLLHLGTATVCMHVKCCLVTKSAHAALFGECNYHMHVQIYVCMYRCMYVCMYVNMYACTVLMRGRLELTVTPYIVHLATGQ